MADWKSELYTGAATIGKIDAYIGAAVGTLIGIIFIIAGIAILTSKNDPNDEMDGDKNQNRMMSGIFILIGIVAIVVGWINLYFTSKSKAYAAVSGGTDVIHGFKNALFN